LGQSEQYAREYKEKDDPHYKVSTERSGKLDEF